LNLLLILTHDQRQSLVVLQGFVQFGLELGDLLVLCVGEQVLALLILCLFNFELDVHLHIDHLVDQLILVLYLLGPLVDR